MSREEPRTLNELFAMATQRRAGRALMRYKREKVWRDLTGAQLDEQVRQVALGLHHLGVQAGDRVALLAESSPEWSITDYAILACGGVTVPLYPTHNQSSKSATFCVTAARAFFSFRRINNCGAFNRRSNNARRPRRN